jgi:hypothetical protein
MQKAKCRRQNWTVPPISRFLPSAFCLLSSVLLGIRGVAFSAPAGLEKFDLGVA